MKSGLAIALTFCLLESSVVVVPEEVTTRSTTRAREREGVVREAYASKTRIDVRLRSGVSVRGTVSSIDAVGFDFALSSGGSRRIEYEDLLSLSKPTNWRLIAGIGVATVGAWLFLRSECFYRC